MEIAFGKLLEGKGRSLIRHAREQMQSLVVAISFGKWRKWKRRSLIFESAFGRRLKGEKAIALYR